MTDQLETLQELQAIDGELYRLRRLRQEKPVELARGREHLTAEEAQLAAIEGRQKQLQLKQKEQEMELQTCEGNVKKLQGQLFQVKTNREYTAMQHEIDGLKTDNVLIEETILQSLEAIEEVIKERKAQQQRVEEEQQQLRQETQRVERELEELTAQISQLEHQRQQLTPSLPSTTLSIYERILVSREGLAMVPIVNESCGGCHWRLPPQVVNEVYLRTSLVTCEHCNRILYKQDSS